jgi:peptidoglycan/xylan/chitin deacetylase (PgdA/CDA1 family)
VRARVKAAVERMLVGSGAASVHRRRMSGRLLVLAYHNIVADDEPPCGDLANHLPLSTFSAQLTALRATHDVVPLAEALAAPARGSTRPRAAITFDDAYRGALIHAVPELARQGLPATFFVTPAFIGGRSFWWDALAAPGGAGLDQDARAYALTELRGDDAAVREWAQRSGRALTAVPTVACAAAETELIHAASLPGISVGSHSWSHPNLTRLTRDELRIEMTRPLAWLRERIANPLPWIAYPYGFFNAAVAHAAAAAGYDAALAVSGGWLPRSPGNRFSLPRVNIPRGLSIRGFVLRGAGLLCG